MGRILAIDYGTKRTGIAIMLGKEPPAGDAPPEASAPRGGDRTRCALDVRAPGGGE